ncbi:MAG: response regulator [Rickettsiales bacterium]|nr:response regulator [Rickettsiales bacterium]
MATNLVGPDKIDNKDLSERLRKIHVLVADEDERIGKLVVNVLQSFGFREIQVAYKAQEAIALLKKAPIDMVITEYPMRTKDGQDLVDFLRTGEESPRRDLPIIVLTGRAERPDVMAARDHGVTEFVVKPFSAKTLSNRITQVIDNPRSFIITKGFVGPDRRRRKQDDNATDSDTRMPESEMERHSTRVGRNTIYSIKGDKVIISDPNRDLQHQIGMDVKAEDILNEEAVQRAQDVIYDMRDEYMDWVAIDINRLQNCWKALKERPDDTKQRAALAEVAFAIKSQAGTFGYHLASMVAKQLHDYVAENRDLEEDDLFIIKKHTDTLLVIFHQQIQGEGDQVGKELLHSLRELIKKRNEQLAEEAIDEVIAEGKEG